MFYLERQNRKKEKMENGNQKSQKLKKTKNIKSQIQCFLEEKHMFFRKR